MTREALRFEPVPRTFGKAFGDAARALRGVGLGKPGETLRPMTEKSILRQAGIGRTQQ